METDHRAVGEKARTGETLSSPRWTDGGGLHEGGHSGLGRREHSKDVFKKVESAERVDGLNVEGEQKEGIKEILVKCQS